MTISSKSSRIVLSTGLMFACSFSLNDRNDFAPTLNLQGKANTSPVMLDWWDPEAPNGTAAIEARAGNEPFREVERAQPPLSFPAGTLPESPQGIATEIRIRSLQSGLVSNVVVLEPSFAVPTLAVRSGSGGFDIDIGWGGGVVGGIVLSRRTTQIDGTSGPVTDLTTVHPSASTAPATFTYVDGDLSGWTDGARYEYSAAPQTASQRGPAVTAGTAQSQLLAPLILPPAFANGVLHLQIQGRSAYGRTIDVNAYHLTSVAPGTIAQIDDPSPPTGLVLFLAIASGFQAYSPPTPRYGWVPPPGANIDVSLLSLPPGSTVARTQASTFAVLDARLPPYATSKGATVFLPGGDLAAALSLPDAICGPDLVLDLNDHPHVACYESATAQSLTHLWHDGTSWQREVIAASKASDGATVRLVRGSDSAGTLHVAWGAGNITAVATRTDAAWASPPLPSVPPGVFAVAGDETGFAHVVAGDGPTLTHLWLDAAGWNSEAIVPSNVSNPSGYGASALFAVAGRVSLILQSLPTMTYGGSFLLERTASGWKEPLIPFPKWGLVHAGLSRDGTQFAVTGPDVSGNLLESIQAGSAVFQSLYMPDSGLPFRAVGIDPDGKAWELFYLPDAVNQKTYPPALFAPQPDNAVFCKQR